MIDMTGQAIRLYQVLMERKPGVRIVNRHTSGSLPADIRHRVTGDAIFRRHTQQGGVAGETVLVQLRMAGTQSARTDHLIWMQKGKHDQHQGNAGGHRDQPAVFQFQPQNRRMAMMWASASMANVAVIG